LYSCLATLAVECRARNYLIFVTVGITQKQSQQPSPDIGGFVARSNNDDAMNRSELLAKEALCQFTLKVKRVTAGLEKELVVVGVVEKIADRLWSQAAKERISGPIRWTTLQNTSPRTLLYSLREIADFLCHQSGEELTTINSWDTRKCMLGANQLNGHEFGRLSLLVLGVENRRDSSLFNDDLSQYSGQRDKENQHPEEHRYDYAGERRKDSAGCVALEKQERQQSSSYSDDDLQCH
jgi:hypothetical protein